MKPPPNAPDDSVRSLLLATAASAAAMMISVYVDESTAWQPTNPLIHPVIGTVAASVTFWLTWPRRGLAALCVFVAMAFAFITIVSMLIVIVMAMPS